MVCCQHTNYYLGAIKINTIVKIMQITNITTFIAILSPLSILRVSFSFFGQSQKSSKIITGQIKNKSMHIIRQKASKIFIDIAMHTANNKATDR